ncbi:unnamed protein product [Cylicocyclus nassatus]|uniref:CWH43-like N-terminal domain-containing protein n=1 Tax=Cylicocyclus nassatus TaxID=53992 RepID=A0AA36H138_CYLNA|nr:unnamed protein product [Cylicocyclus nassatus]
MVVHHVWIMPVLSVTCALIAMFSGYSIGVAKERFPPFFPFISDGGGYSPEANIFGQFLNMAGFLYVITVYVVHIQIVAFYGHVLKWNRSRWYYSSLLLMYIGFLSALGMTMVANFRYTEILPAHMIGAMMTFIAMVIYGWGHAIFGYVVIPRMIALGVIHFRFVLIILTTCCLILHQVAASSLAFVPDGAGAGENPGIEGMRSEESPFHKTYSTATSCEWGMILVMQVFILTFIAELRLLRACSPFGVEARQAGGRT